MTKRTTLDLGLSNGGESLNLRTKEIVLPPPDEEWCDFCFEQRLVIVDGEPTCTLCSETIEGGQ